MLTVEESDGMTLNNYSVSIEQQDLDHDVVVIGGGPKGLSTHLALLKRGLDSVLIERAPNVGRSWEKDRMNPRMPLTPMGHEITDYEGYRFVDFWAEKGPKEVRKYPLNRGLITATHYRHYLKWLAKKTGNIRCQTDVENISYSNGSFNLQTSNGPLRSRAAVVSTGMVGYKGQEFVSNITGLLDQSDLVTHHPGRIITRGEMVNFVGDSKEIAALGAGISLAALLCQLGADRLPELRKIHVIADHVIEASSFENGPLREDREGRIVSTYPDFFAHLLEDPRIVLHGNHRVLNSYEVDDGIQLDMINGGTGAQKLRVDRVVEITGYRFDISRIPILRILIQEGIISLNETGRYPVIGENYRSNNQAEAPLYFLGEAAAGTYGSMERFLPRTAVAANDISDDIQKLSRVKRPFSQFTLSH